MPCGIIRKANKKSRVYSNEPVTLWTLSKPGKKCLLAMLNDIWATLYNLFSHRMKKKRWYTKHWYENSSRVFIWSYSLSFSNVNLVGGGKGASVRYRSGLWPGTSLMHQVQSEQEQENNPKENLIKRKFSNTLNFFNEFKSFSNRQEPRAEKVQENKSGPRIPTRKGRLMTGDATDNGNNNWWLWVQSDTEHDILIHPRAPCD